MIKLVNAVADLCALAICLVLVPTALIWELGQQGVRWVARHVQP